MKALVCKAFRDDLSTLEFQDISLPALGPEDVRVAMRAACVNFPDLLMTDGKYQFKPEPPYVVGQEMAGDVIAVGSAVTRFKIGDRVISGGLTGAFAEEVQRPQAQLRALPQGADYASGAAFTAAYLTAYVALVRRAEIKAGEWLLVHGAAGGMGLAAVDLGKLLGARVIATASTAAKRDFLKSYGADHALPSQGFREAVKGMTGGGADVIYDPVGGDVFDESVRCIGFNGRLLVVGFTSGRIPSVSVNMPLIKGFSVVGVRAGEYGRKFPEKGRENIAAIDRLLAEKKIRPHVGARFPLERAVDAMRTLKDRTIIGKAVIEF
ncbi:MAG TPA: NADPH:quinone oxidoreductase family protein [Rhizomicrobium sp.]|nr:NADPH:quinone oxidoreductase family protein [Rhizomicrobium sp.]